MARPVTTFRVLIDAARRKGLRPTDRCRTMLWVADACGVSIAQIYNLVEGRQTAHVYTVARIAEGLGLTSKYVSAALARSREAGVLR